MGRIPGILPDPGTLWTILPPRCASIDGPSRLGTQASVAPPRAPPGRTGPAPRTSIHRTLHHEAPSRPFRGDPRPCTRRHRRVLRGSPHASGSLHPERPPRLRPRGRTHRPAPRGRHLRRGRVRGPRLGVRRTQDVSPGQRAVPRGRPREPGDRGLRRLRRGRRERDAGDPGHGQRRVRPRPRQPSRQPARGHRLRGPRPRPGNGRGRPGHERQDGQAGAPRGQRLRHGRRGRGPGLRGPRHRRCAAFGGGGVRRLRRDRPSLRLRRGLLRGSG